MEALFGLAESTYSHHFFGANSWCPCSLIFKDLTLIARNPQDRCSPGDVYKTIQTFFAMTKGIRVSLLSFAKIITQNQDDLFW